MSDKALVALIMTHSGPLVRDIYKVIYLANGGGKNLKPNGNRTRNFIVFSFFLHENAKIKKCHCKYLLNIFVGLLSIILFVNYYFLSFSLILFT